MSSSLYGVGAPAAPIPPRPGASYRSRQGWGTWRCTDGRKWSIRRGRSVNKTRTTVRLNRRERRSRGGNYFLASHERKKTAKKLVLGVLIDQSRGDASGRLRGAMLWATSKGGGGVTRTRSSAGHKTRNRNGGKIRHWRRRKEGYGNSKSSRSWLGLSRHSQLKDVQKQFKTFSKHKIENERSTRYSNAQR